MQRPIGKIYNKDFVLAVTRRSKYGVKFICDEFLSLFIARLSNVDFCSFNSGYIGKSVSASYILKSRLLQQMTKLIYMVILKFFLYHIAKILFLILKSKESIRPILLLLIFSLIFSNCRTSGEHLLIPKTVCPDIVLPGYIVNNEGLKLEGRIRCMCNDKSPTAFVIDAEGGDQFEASAEDLMMVRLEDDRTEPHTIITYSKINGYSKQYLHVLLFANKEFQILSDFKGEQTGQLIFTKGDLVTEVHINDVQLYLDNAFEKCQYYGSHNWLNSDWNDLLSKLMKYTQQCF